MYKVKLEQLSKAQNVLARLFNSRYSDIKLSYSASKMAKKINPIFDEMNKRRMELIDKYAKKDEKTNKPIIITDVSSGQPITKYDLGENEEVFNKEYEAILTEEVELDIWGFTPGHIAAINATPNEINLIEPFLKLEEDKDEAEDQIEDLTNGEGK